MHQGGTDLFIEDDLHAINEWGQQVWQRKQIDAHGSLSVTTFDTHHRLANSLVIDPTGNPLQEETFRYDTSGHLILHTISTFGADSRNFSTKWAYNHGLLTEKVEFASSESPRISSFEYTKGKLSKEIKPDGTSIVYSYDAAGRIEEVRSSDRTLHYRYHYQGMDRLISVDDLINNESLHRNYNDRGLLIEETVGNGQTISFTYDSFGRRT